MHTAAHSPSYAVSRGGYTQATSGIIDRRLRLSAEYELSRQVGLEAYYEYSRNVPLVSAYSFPISTSSYGLSLRITAPTT